MLQRIFSFVFTGVAPSFHRYFRLMQYFRQQGFPRLALITSNRIAGKYNVFLSPKACLSRNVSFRHPTGIVIGDGVIVGDGVVIYQNVTLGGARIGDAMANNYPAVGDGTVIFAGAVIAGHVKIGKNCIIGANAVVLHDIPDNSTAVGVPARVVASRALS